MVSSSASALSRQSEEDPFLPLENRENQKNSDLEKIDGWNFQRMTRLKLCMQPPFLALYADLKENFGSAVIDLHQKSRFCLKTENDLNLMKCSNQPKHHPYNLCTPEKCLTPFVFHPIPHLATSVNNSIYQNCGGGVKIGEWLFNKLNVEQT